MSLDFEVRGFAVEHKSGITGEALLRPDPSQAEGDAWTSEKTKLVWDGFAQQHGEAAVLTAIQDQGWQRTADSALLDERGEPLSETRLRRFLKGHFGHKSPARVKQATQSRISRDLGFAVPVRSAAELRQPAPVEDDAPFYADTGEHGGQQLPAERPVEPLEPVRSEVREFYANDQNPQSEDEEAAQAEDPGLPSTPHTQLLTAYAARVGGPAVAEALTREELQLDAHAGMVVDRIGHALSYQDLAAVLTAHLGPLTSPGQGRKGGAPDYAVVIPASEANHYNTD